MKKLLCLILTLVLLSTLTSALADPWKTKELRHPIPIKNENGDVYMTHSITIANLNYRWTGDWDCRTNIFGGSLKGKFYPARRHCAFTFTAPGPEYGFKPSFAADGFSYDGFRTVTIHSSNGVKR